MGSSFTFVRVRGIAIGAHWSWLLVFALVVQSLSFALFPSEYPGWTQATYLAVGIAAAVLLFVCLLLHELAHAFRALREGMRIDGITLWLFGGVARLSGWFPSAGAEFRIAIAGPLASLGLAGVFLVLAAFFEAVGAPAPFGALCDYLARINALLMAFNMVPALPLDGGRVLRAWLWHRQHDLSSATSTAATAGRVFGIGLVAIGLLGAVTGIELGGLWLVFIGWFLTRAARAEEDLAGVRRVLTGRTVSDVMTGFIPVDAESSVQDVLDGAVLRKQPIHPVMRGDGLVGAITLQALGSVAEDRRALTRVEELMLPVDRITTLEASRPATDVTDLVARTDAALVVDRGRPVGVVSASDIERAVEMERRLHVAHTSGRGTRALVWTAVAVAIAIVASAFYRPPMVVIEPGIALDVSRDITISGVASEQPTGRYLLTAVRISRPTLLGTALAAVDPGKDVQAFSTGFAGAPGASFQRRQFEDSRMLAAAAAAQAVGLSAGVDGSGAVVQGIVTGAPAEDVLRQGDVIVAVNGDDTTGADELQEEITSRPPGSAFRLTVQRDGQRIQVPIESAVVGSGPPRIGVSVTTRDFDIDLPFDIRFRDRNIGGSSAGLAYALAIADMLDDVDYAEGRTIAATGQIAVDGEVGPVGAVDLKTVAARRAGASVFVVPEGQVGDVGEGLDTTGSDSLANALRSLRDS